MSPADESAPGATPRASTFRVVGLGASAGGVEPLQQFLAALPARPGMAFVIVTHARANRPSQLVEVLARKTSLPVTEVVRPTILEPDHVYVAPPGRRLHVVRETLVPVAPAAGATEAFAIDTFFRSLARELRGRAVGVVLSGAGTDGALGLREIKGNLGLALAQREDTATYPDMPHSAITSQQCDAILSVAEMPAWLLRLGEAPADEPELADSRLAEGFNEVLQVLRVHLGHDFGNYKPSTMHRRIQRRMELHDIETPEAYARYLSGHAGEVNLLLKDLLISVTSFFRDPEAFTRLERAIREQLSRRPDGERYRVWVPACATGEEAYSIAMIARDALDRAKSSAILQVFATDLDASAIALAREGLYPHGIADDVQPERLERYFVREDEGYRVKESLRRHVLFAVHDVLKDPPFSRLDLLSCRNLLIYFETRLQAQLLPVFHYAVKPGGLVFLGSSESVGQMTHLFQVVDAKAKLFRTLASAVRRHRLDPTFAAARPPALVGAAERAASSLPMEQLLLRELLPPTVVFRANGQIVYIHGRTGQFLEPTPGASLPANLFAMARGQRLRQEIAAALDEVRTGGASVVRTNVFVDANGGILTDLRLKAAPVEPGQEALFLLCFEPSTGGATPLDAAAGRAATAPSAPAREPPGADAEEQRLLEEELQSNNEELQAINEELQTAKEELQSSNEELGHLNHELEVKVEELLVSDTDLRNLVATTQAAVLFADSSLAIRRLTPAALALLGSRAGDPQLVDIAGLARRLGHEELEVQVQHVLQVQPIYEAELGRPGDTWLRLRVQPYRNVDHAIDGVVITLSDTTVVKRLQASERRMLAALHGSPTCLFGEDLDGRILWSSGKVLTCDGAFAAHRVDRELFGAAAAEVLARLREGVRGSGHGMNGILTVVVNGKSCEFALHAEPMLEAQAIVGVAFAATDIEACMAGARKTGAPSRE